MPEENLEGQIALWRDHLEQHRSITDHDLAEIEDHLRSAVEDLVKRGLTDTEAFLIAIRRLGNADEVSREFAHEHIDRLWKQFAVEPSDDPDRAGRVAPMLLVALMAGLAVRAVVAWIDEPSAVLLTPLIAASALATHLAISRGARTASVVTAAVGFVALATILISHQFDGSETTFVLAALHGPVVAWGLVGLVHTDLRRESRSWMDFIRFSGEWAIYYTLLALGGAALTALTIGAFAAVQIDATTIVVEWLLPSCAAGAVVVAAWLVEFKKSVIENMAPVLALVFTPLTLAMVTGVLVAFLTRPNVIETDRELLILMTVILVLVLALHLFSMSARDDARAVGTADQLQFALLAAALVADVVLLVAMVVRVAEFGPSANKVAALGLNILVLVNLARSALLSARFARGRARLTDLERWQTGYLPIFVAWAAVVALAFPPVFAFS